MNKSDSFCWTVDEVPDWWKETKGIQIDVARCGAIIPSAVGSGIAYPGDHIIRDTTGRISVRKANPADPSKRSFVRLAGIGAAWMAVGGVIAPISLPGAPEPACSVKDLSGWVVTIAADYGEIKTLLPQLGLSKMTVDRISGLIDKALTVARDFDAAYKAGKLADVKTTFLNLGTLITQIAGELGVVKNRLLSLLIVGIQIARITLASLIDKMIVVAPASMTMNMSADDVAAVAEVKRLASIDVSKVLAVIQ